MAETDPRRFYVYALVDPRDRRAFYIGKGTGKRAKAHEAQAKREGPNPAKRRKIRQILASGMRPKIAYLARDLTEAEAFERERHEISARRGLTNIAPGGSSAPEQAQLMLAEIKARERQGPPYTLPEQVFRLWVEHPQLMREATAGLKRELRRTARGT